MRWFIQKNYWRQGIKKTEYIKALVRGSVLLFIITLLFYQSLLINVFMLPFLLIYMYRWEFEYMEKRKQLFQLQFCDVMQSLTAALSVGYSMENAMKEVVKDLRPVYSQKELILREFLRMEQQLKMSIPVEQVWQEFATRVRQEDVENFTTVFGIAKRSGGNAIVIMKNAMSQIQEKIEVKREIATMMTEKKLEFKVMATIPLAMLGYMYVCFPDFMGMLYQNIVGRVVMTICLSIYALAYWMGKKIVEIEV